MVSNYAKVQTHPSTIATNGTGQISTTTRILIVDGQTLLGPSIQCMMAQLARYAAQESAPEPAAQDAPMNPHLARQMIRRPGENAKAHKARIKAYLNNPQR